MRKLLVLLGVVLAGLLATASSAMSEDFTCNGTFTGETFDDVTVPKNGECTLIDSTVAGDVEVLKDAYFQSTGTAIGGDVEGKKAQTIFIDTGSRVFGHVHGRKTIQVFIFNSTVIRSIRIWDATDVVNVCGNTVLKGDVSVERSGRDILVGDPLTVGCAGNVVRRGDIEVEDNFVDVELVVRGNTIRRGDLEVVRTRGPADKFVDSNTGGDRLRCKSNSDQFSANGNSGWKHKTGQCG